MPFASSGWKPSAFDGRDAQFTSGETERPRRLILPHPLPVRDQAGIPCCVSIAICVCMEVLDAREGEVEALAPLYHYYVARRGSPDFAAIEPRAGLSVAMNTGICAARLHEVPFDEDGARQSPGADAHSDAAQRKLLGRDKRTGAPLYQAIGGHRRADACRAAIAGGSPVMLGFWMTPAYDTLSPERPVHAPTSRETSSEGHTVAAIGYDDEMESLLIKDSRGEGFGEGGLWWLPYQAVDSRLVHEAWVLRRISYDR